MTSKKYAIENLSPTERPTLRKGSKGNAVKYLQLRLIAALKDISKNNAVLISDGDFGEITEDAVKLFQYRYGLNIDGIVGTNTWRKLEYNELIIQLIKKYNIEPQKQLVSIAVPYIGATETGNNFMGTDQQMREIFEADDLELPDGFGKKRTDGYAWCCSFVSLCVQKLISKNIISYSAITPPREASVSRFLNSWGKNQKCLIFSPKSKVINPEIGDIVIFTFSHIGIVESVEKNIFTTIEGNTDASGGREGKEVAIKERSRTLVKC